MACHEIAALRISLHRILGSRPPHEKDHELVELGAACTGALQAVTEAQDFASLRRAFEAAATDLEARVEELPPTEPQRGYYQALVVTVRSTQRQIERIQADVERFYLDIEDTHDLLHEIFPGSDLDG